MWIWVLPCPYSQRDDICSYLFLRLEFVLALIPLICWIIAKYLLYMCVCAYAIVEGWGTFIFLLKWFLWMEEVGGMSTPWKVSLACILNFLHQLEFLPRRSVRPVTYVVGRTIFVADRMVFPRTEQTVSKKCSPRWFWSCWSSSFIYLIWFVRFNSDLADSINCCDNSSNSTSFLSFSLLFIQVL